MRPLRSSKSLAGVANCMNTENPSVPMAADSSGTISHRNEPAASATRIPSNQTPIALRATWRTTNRPTAT